MPSKAIVIGAGVGGLATAIRLAVKGYEVEVHEKNSVTGGKMHLIQKDGFSFDAGPSLFTQPANIEELFALAEVDIHEHFIYEKVEIACRYFFENGKRLDAFTDANDFGEEMERVLGEPKEQVAKYLNIAEKTYQHVGTVFLNHSLHKASTWLHPRILKALSSVKAAHLFGTLDGMNRSFFKTPEAVQVFNRYATYNGSNPFAAPGMLSMIPHLEMNEGTFYPKGGMNSIPAALTALAERKGVKFVLGSKVESISHQQGKVNGVVADGRMIPADVVVSNVDAYFTYRDLLQDAAGAKKILRNERSSSAMIFYWGINKTFEQLHLHNIFFSNGYEEEFDHIFRKKSFYSDPTVYINITSKLEAVHAPEGCENWFVMVNAPAMTGADWDQEVKKTRTDIIQKLSRMLSCRLEDHIVVEEVLTPRGIEQRTDSYLGSLYGTSSNSKWAAFMRHANQSHGLSGLYFTGGSVHPGGGIPLCLKSAAIVDGLVDYPA